MNIWTKFQNLTNIENAIKLHFKTNKNPQKQQLIVLSNVHEHE